MPPPSTFFCTVRLLWVGVNVAILIVTVSGYRDLSGLTFILSFPADAVVGVILLLPIEAVTPSGPAWLENLLLGIVAFISGYVQWFVIGRALAQRVFMRLPSRRLLRVTRVGIVFVFLGLTLLGLSMVRAQDEARNYFDRAMTVREGMTIDEVRSILGDPKVDEPATTENLSFCPAGTRRKMSYWYEHEWLWRRLSSDSFFLPLCLDQEGKVISVGRGHAH